MKLIKIGKWKIYPIEMGTFWLDGGAMMGSVPKVLWAKTNIPDSLNRIKLALRCLLVDDGKNLVLIETGIGNKNSNKFCNMFNIDIRNTLSDTLSDIGYSVENIKHVILTHLHFDHAGGATMFDVDGSIVPTFPNAKYYITAKNWNAAINPNPKDRASYLKENFMILHEKGILEIIPENSTILDGISTYVVNGHTQGQQLVRVSDEEATLFFCSDLIPLKSHLSLPWIMGYDLNASLTLDEKKAFLDLASQNKWILYFYHDPKVVAVTIEKKENRYVVVDEYR